MRYTLALAAAGALCLTLVEHAFPRVVSLQARAEGRDRATGGAR